MNINELLGKLGEHYNRDSNPHATDFEKNRDFGVAGDSYNRYNDD